jgi:Cof subfamily protein (haloacid dehalogenase superfamily)
MERRAVFLDVDGTLVNHRGLVPDSAAAAVRAARANGHLVFLCTGRSLSALWRSILDIGFDGLVAAAGGYVETGGQVLVHHHVPAAEVARVTGFFDAHGVEYLLECNDGVFGSPGVRQRIQRILAETIADDDLLAEVERGGMAFVDRIQVVDDPTRLHVNKVSFLGSDLTLERIREEFAARFDVIPSTVPLFGASSGELSLRGVHKASGIAVLIEHLGIPREHTVAFGDGFNDLEMLEFAGVGVAMGQAPPAVAARADRRTGSPDEDGIRTGFAELGLI